MLYSIPGADITNNPSLLATFVLNLIFIFGLLVSLTTADGHVKGGGALTQVDTSTAEWCSQTPPSATAAAAAAVDAIGAATVDAIAAAAAAVHEVSAVAAVTAAAVAAVVHLHQQQQPGRAFSLQKQGLM